jgi:AcrR family transcriptional regulator
MPAKPKVPSDSRPARRRAPERLLSLDAIYRAALQIVDTEGLEAVTIRRLALDLGVGTMTLYRYVATKEEILNGVADLAFQALDTDSDPNAPWEERVTGVFRSMHRAMQEHPGILRILLDQPLGGPRMYRVGETVLGILHGAGFDDADAVAAITAVESYVVGLAVLEISHTGGHRPSEVLARLKSLPPDEFPNLVRAAPHQASRDFTAALEHGLRDLLDGLRRDPGRRTGQRRSSATS